MSKDRDPEGRRLRLIEPDGREAEKRQIEAETASRELSAALRPSELDGLDHEALLALTLGDDVVDIPEQERHAAEQLRLALEGVGDHPLAQLAASLRCSSSEAELGEADNSLLLAAALQQELVVCEQERAEADQLRLALQGQGRHALADLAEALRLTQHEGDAYTLAAADNEVLLALTLGEAADLGEGADCFAEAEHEAGEDLRQALEADSDDHPLAQLARSLRAATGDGQLNELSVERALRRAMGPAIKPRPAAKSATRVMLTGAVAALAAGFALLFGSLAILETTESSARGDQDKPAPSEAAMTALVEPRSTQPLFDPMTRFATKGGESKRLGRIVAARAADLRANRFAAWGVR